MYHCGGWFSTCGNLLKYVITPSTDHIHMLVYIWKGTYSKETGEWTRCAICWRIGYTKHPEDKSSGQAVSHLHFPFSRYDL